MKKQNSGQTLCAGQSFPLILTILLQPCTMKQGMRLKDTQPEIEQWDWNQVLCCSTMDKVRIRKAAW